MNPPPTIPQAPADARRRADELYDAYRRASRLDDWQVKAVIRRDLFKLGFVISITSPPQLVPRPTRLGRPASDFIGASGADRTEHEATPGPLARRPGPSFELRGDGRAANPVTLRGDTLDSSECSTNRVKS